MIADHIGEFTLSENVIQLNHVRVEVNPVGGTTLDSIS